MQRLGSHHPAAGRGVASMFSVMTWNVENSERPAANAKQAVKDRYARKLQQISELITSTGPDLVGYRRSSPTGRISRHECLMTFVRRWARSGMGAYPSGPTLAVFGWGGWPVASCPPPPMSPSIRNRCRPPRSTTMGTRSRRSPRPSAGRSRSPTPAVTA